MTNSIPDNESDAVVIDLAELIVQADSRIEVEAQSLDDLIKSLPSIRPHKEFRRLARKLNRIYENGLFNDDWDNDENAYEFNDPHKVQLKKKGMRILGAGSWATVVTYPRKWSRCIKVGQNGDGWLAWAAFCMFMHRIGNYPNLPIIYDMIFFDNCYVALLERYAGTWEEFEYQGISSVKRPYHEVQNEYDCIYDEVVNNEGNPWYDHPLCPELSDWHSDNVMVSRKGHIMLIDLCCDSDGLSRSHRSIFKTLGLVK